MSTKGHEVSFGGDGNVLKLDFADDYTLFLSLLRMDRHLKQLYFHSIKFLLACLVLKGRSHVLGNQRAICFMG